MDNLTIAVITVVVLVVLYLVFYKSEPIQPKADPNKVANDAIIKAATSCAAIKDEDSYNKFVLDYVVADAAIAAVTSPTAELTNAIVDFHNLDCSQYSGYITMSNLFEVAYDKVLVANPSESDLKNCAIITANIIYFGDTFTDTTKYPAYLAKKLVVASEKLDIIKKKGRPPPGLVKYFADELLKLVMDEEVFVKRQTVRGFQERYNSRLNRAKIILAQWEAIGPSGLQGDKLKSMQLLQR